MSNLDTKQQLLEALKEVFGEGDNPAQMKILVRRIPIICTNIEEMHEGIKDIKEHVFKIDSKLNGEILRNNKQMEEKLKPFELDRVENTLVRKIVFGMVALIITAVLLALVGLVIVNK